jgi:Ribbon-helix-helix protein, copG family
MSRASADPKPETVTFRIPAALKAAIVELAEREAMPVGELLRELVAERLDRERRCAFEAEARRQSLELAAAAQDPNSDEAAVMRELDANFAEFAREWK